MSSPVHIMLDLETFGTAPGSVILSIGACVFDANGPSENPAHRFEVHIVVKDAVRAGLVLDPDTVLWWLGQSEAARSALLAGQKFGNGAMTLYGALHDLSNWLNAVAPDIKARLIWGKGPSFDCGLLAAAYRKSSYNGSELPLPWRYPNERCVRTITALCPHIPEPPREGVHHSALDDALHQARHVGACLKWLAKANERTTVGAQTCCARDDAGTTGSAGGPPAVWEGARSPESRYQVIPFFAPGNTTKPHHFFVTDIEFVQFFHREEAEQVAALLNGPVDDLLEQLEAARADARIKGENLALAKAREAKLREALSLISTTLVDDGDIVRTAREALDANSPEIPDGSPGITDTQRLDWLESRKAASVDVYARCALDHERSRVWSEGSAPVFSTKLRLAIDAAMGREVVAAMSAKGGV